METEVTITPAQAGVQTDVETPGMDPGLRRDDELDWLN